MLNPLNFFKKFIKSSNQIELGKIQKIVDKVNTFENKISNLDDKSFPKKTEEFVRKISEGVSLDKILPEACALVREASK